MTKFLKKIAPFLILGSFLILSALLPEILGEDAKTLAENYLGENYIFISVAFFLILFFFAARINPEIGMGLFSKTDKSKPERYNIPPTDENHELLHKAKASIAASHPDQALELLSTLKLKSLYIEITALNARLADLERAYIRGTVSNGDKTTEQNKINESFILLITALEKEIAQSFEFYDKIRAALKSRYETRLSQKLSNRQPVNLRLVPSTAGTTPQAADTFVQYSEGQIRGKLVEYYKEANGRLLLVGVPGSGKTTLLLQLVLELLDKETTRIPVVLNLARWSSTFSKFEDWVQAILPSEMGLTINKKMAGDLIAQNRLILLLDGLDEIKEEDRQVCLEAIGAYGEGSSRYFILSSRNEEYKAVAKDAPVNSQVEVGTLTYEQLVGQLEKTEKNEGSKRLVAALKEDELLREVAEVPFYFNTLQLLFARGKYLHEFNFSAQDIEGRKKEIERNFVYEMFKKSDSKDYYAQSIIKYLEFYASRLKRENLVDFELIHLQYWWCKLSKWETRVGELLKNLVEYPVEILLLVLVGALKGASLGVQVGAMLGAWVGAILGALLSGLVFSFRGDSCLIETRDNIRWDWSIFIKKGFLKFGIIGGIFLGGIFLFLGGIFGGLGCVLILRLMVQLKFNYSSIQINNPYQRFRASAKVFYFSILQHWHLCHVLHKKGLLPKKLVPFLNDMVKCNILETAGASWRFRHRILQDYFADQWVETEFEPEQK